MLLSVDHPITAQENDTSDTLIAETFDDEVICSTTGGSSLSRGDVQEDFRRADAPTSTTTSTVDRYFKQKRSAQGKVAYVVFSGRDAGVFYNWYVFVSYCEVTPTPKSIS